MNQTFFDIDTTGLRASQVTYAGCNKCGLCEKCETPKMGVQGEGHKQILVVTDFPDAKDDFHNSRWHGKNTKYLAKLLYEQGIDVSVDCWHIHAVSCRPAHGKFPSSRHVGLCRPKVLKAVDRLSPKLIVLAGKLAVESVIGDNWKKNLGGIGRWRGWQIPDRQFEAHICPVWSPYFVLNKHEDCPVVEDLYKKDIKGVGNCLEKLSESNNPYCDLDEEESCVRCCVNPKEARECLKTVLRASPSKIAFDYETTGLKPHRTNHKIVSCSIATSTTSAFAFCLEDDQETKNLLVQILTNPNIQKVASNIQFEESWTKNIFGVSVEGWLWDTMLMAHVLDNRPKISSIKFQYYVNFGLADYDSHISPLLKSDLANGFNSIHKIPKRQLLLYNGMDSLLEFRVAEMQMKELKVIKNQEVG